ncbi:MAG: hypothetical protein RIG62_01690 [Cyclobacteriaceae bacterium]
MMRLIGFMTVFVTVLALNSGCSSEEESLYTGREIQYNLLEGSYLETTTSGYITVRERNDHSIDIQLLLEGTLDNAIHPVHLHYGSLQDDGLVAEFLDNVEDTGNHHSQSITHLTQLSDGSTMTYDRFIDMDGSIKVHFEEEGALKDVILGATNIGTNYNIADLGLAGDITICNSKTQ